MPTQDLLDIEVTEDIAGDLASSGILDETSEAAHAEVYAGSRDDGLEEMVASEISVQTPRNKVAIDKAAALLSPPSIPVDKTAAMLSPSSIPTQSPLGVSSEAEESFATSRPFPLQILRMIYRTICSSDFLLVLFS